MQQASGVNYFFKTSWFALSHLRMWLFFLIAIAFFPGAIEQNVSAVEFAATSSLAPMNRSEPVLVVNGVDQFIEIKSNINLSATSFSIELWAKRARAWQIDNIFGQ